MALKHSVYDTGIPFSINVITKTIQNKSPSKTTLIQYDHNSERLTFEIPRFIEGHDMSLCNVIQVHYNNIDASTKAQSKGVYEVDDVQISPEDENVVILSWLISHNATKHAGVLNFLIRFSCVDDDGNITYAWNTAIYSGISVSTGIYNGEVIVEEYADILEQWKKELEETIRLDEIRTNLEQHSETLEQHSGELEAFQFDLENFYEKINYELASPLYEWTADDKKFRGVRLTTEVAEHNTFPVTSHAVYDAIQTCIPKPSGSAEVGQFLTVKAVDENGKPTEWATADLPVYNGEVIE